MQEGCCCPAFDQDFLDQLLHFKNCDIYYCANDTCNAFEYSVRNGRNCARHACTGFRKCVACRMWYCNHCVVSYGVDAKCKKCDNG
jgi:hypothetical protein